MKRTAVAVCLILLSATLVFAQAGTLCLFSDPQGTDCTINDIAPGLITVYVYHMQAVNVQGAQFSAPVPACMGAATYLGETSPWPNVIGWSQTGVFVGYPECSASPIHVLTINIFGTAASLADCPYEVLPDPSVGYIEMTDCDNNKLPGTGGTTFVNSSLPCVCGTPSPPTLYVSPLTVDFGVYSTVESFVIGNLGGGTLTWGVTETIPWLDATPTSGTGGATVTVTVDRSGLLPGSHSGLISVTSNGGNETVTAMVNVPSPDPVLGVTPPSLTYAATENSKSLVIFNTGSGDLDWSIASDQTWLSVNPESGTNNTNVSVSVDRTGLGDGTYYGNLDVTSNGGDLTVPVDMIVSLQPVLSVEPMMLGFSESATTRTFTIANTGTGTLDWSVSDNRDWIEIVPPLSGTGNATVTVNVDPSSVPSGGIQYGSITVASNGGTKYIEVRYVPPNASQAGNIGVFANPEGWDCNIHDTGQGLLQVYVVHVNSPGATASQFAAPMPACMAGAAYLSDSPEFPVNVGDSQTGIAIGYGACYASPIHLLTINYYAAGLTSACCPYPVIPDPDAASGKIEVVNCATTLVFGTGLTSMVNPTTDCRCGEIKVEESTWGRVKALYAPPSVRAIQK